jgi:hypothetical protein
MLKMLLRRFETSKCMYEKLQCQVRKIDSRDHAASRMLETRKEGGHETLLLSGRNAPMSREIPSSVQLTAAGKRNVLALRAGVPRSSRGDNYDADVDDDSCDVRTASQSQHTIRNTPTYFYGVRNSRSTDNWRR